ncbi:cytochrome P450 [Allokutzneria sp. A3M-2-11 16]|uniref:cytochrome P450 n=1 Tax=Allokutzneria sp. A3M-2-11 16 TaxID=2962043 RepID=UPI0020B8C54C|nr:cytochrome P450 [Allokutzneria sp. A3M-2-11 16]MCP3801380.1 cytochrome P450 [Allokutzneria sp. A3M-2-11 16]
MTTYELGPVALPTKRATGCPFDPPAELAELREERPVSRMTYPDGHVGWLVTSHAAARAVLADARFSARAELQHTPVLTFAGEIPPAQPGQLITMDAPEHTRYRRLLMRQFTAARLSSLEAGIRRIVTECLDALENAGPPADLVSIFATPVPSLVIGELLGVPEADRQLFAMQTDEVAAMTDPEAIMAAYGRTVGYMYSLVAAKRAAPTEGDLLGALVVDGELTDEELVNISMMLFVGGTETTTNMIAHGVYALLENPLQLKAFLADPNAQAIEELFRYLSIPQYGVPVRAALEDVELEGQLIAAGETVTISVPAANRDPRVFTDPDKLLLDRANSASHVAFGHGVHRCLGQQLARMELRIAYTALFERFPALRLAEPGVVPRMRESDVIYGPSSLPVAW